MKNIGRDFEVTRVEPLQRRSPSPIIVHEYHICLHCDIFPEDAGFSNASTSNAFWLGRIGVITGSISNPLPSDRFEFT